MGVERFVKPPRLVTDILYRGKLLKRNRGRKLPIWPAEPTRAVQHGLRLRGIIRLCHRPAERAHLVRVRVRAGVRVRIRVRVKG